MKVRYRARALSDLEAISRYLEPRSPVGARNVLNAIHVAIAIVADRLYRAERTSDPDVRVKILGRYRYKIFFAVIGTDTVEIIHVRHTARQPWQGGK